MRDGGISSRIFLSIHLGVNDLHQLPNDPGEAIKLQNEVRKLVKIGDYIDIASVRLVGGVDVAYLGKGPRRPVPWQSCGIACRVKCWKAFTLKMRLFFPISRPAFV